MKPGSTFIPTLFRRKYALFFICTIAFTACTPEKNESAPEQVLLNESGWIQDGSANSYKLDKGRYKVEMTASAGGASIEWVGVDCPGSNETKSFSEICDVPSLAQIVIKNPTTFGLGDPSSVSIRITRLQTPKS